MSLHLITPPTDDVVTVDEARAQLRLSDSITDAMIGALIKAAVDQLDPAGGGWLGRALRPQTWELRSNGFPYGYLGSGYTRDFHTGCGAFELPYPPHLLVEHVKYDDGDGVEQTLVEGTGFRVIELGSIGKAYVSPVYNGSWPTSVRSDVESVRVRFMSGYEISTGADPLPPPIKQAVLLMAKHLLGLGERNLFVSAESVDGVGSKQFVVSENAAMVMKQASESLLSTYRVYD